MQFAGKRKLCKSWSAKSRVHKIIKFSQKALLKLCTDMNTRLTTERKT